MPRHIVCLTFDFDTMAGFIARGLTTPTPLSRGEFGARASARILDFLESRGIRSTWFTPGFTIESFPRECEAVVKAGHEIAHHGWTHVPPADQSREAEEADLVRANEAILRLTGQKARGYRSPSWDLERPHHRPPGRARLPLRFQHDGRGLLALPGTARRRRDTRRALPVRRGNRADRDADQLVARRLSLISNSCARRRRSCRACSRRARSWPTGSTNSST